MNKSFKNVLIILPILLGGCTSNATNSDKSGEDSKQSGSNSQQTVHNYQCTVEWDGYTPIPTFSIDDGSMTSDEIAPLFVEKISRKVISYPSETANGMREHKVTYLLKEDNNCKFEFSTTNEEFTLENVDINQQGVLNYLRATTLQEQYQALIANKGVSLDTAYYVLDVPTYGNEVTTIYLADDAEFTTNVTKYQTSESSYKFEYLLPGQTCYWKAIAKSSNVEFDGGLFKVNKDNIKYANYSRVGNFRDLGGWSTGENTRVKYNKIFRGRNGDSLNVTEKNSITENYGFKTQIDLRADADGPIKVRICDNVNYYFMNTKWYYDYMIDRYMDDKAGMCITPDADDGRRLTYKEIYQKIFNLLGNENNYPIYIHCIHGADRTGTLAFIINALLGVGIDDLTKDFELTTFSSSGMRLRGKENAEKTSFEEPLVDYSGSVRFQSLINLFNGQAGDTYKDKVANYLINVLEIPAETIANIRQILTEQI